MVARICKKNLIVICDCIDCPNIPTWRQSFITRKKKIIIVDLCEEHHFILRTKVPNDIELNEDVLKWLLIQDANVNKVVKYGVLRSSTDIKVAKELKKIELEYEQVKM